MPLLFSATVAAALCLSATAAPQNILNFGAIAGDAAYATAILNGQALAQAVVAANSSSSSGDARTVLIPAGNFSFLPAVPTFTGVSNVALQFEGGLFAQTANLSMWPGYPSPYTLISFSSCANLAVYGAPGSPGLQGNGWIWWTYVVLTGIDHRVNLLDVFSCSNLTIDGLTAMNSPQYHLNLHDISGASLRNINIYVDVLSQSALLYRHGLMSDNATTASGIAARAALPSPLRERVAARLPDAAVAGGDLPNGIPMFPLNTDGIDIAGQNVVITNLTCTNFDDVVAVKPMHAGGGSAFGFNCTSNILIDGSDVTLGVGMSMGSVPPNPGVNCIDGVIIRNVNFTTPIKSIYVKPNPGDNGYGLIRNISYEHINIVEPLWWAVYVGTQQQDQPGGGAGTGCSFFYPLNGTICPTNPRVTVTGISLTDVNVTGGLLSPGILIANVSNPATNFTWNGVRFNNPSDWPVPLSAGGYLCTQVSGTAVGSYPVPPCFKSLDGEGEEAQEGRA